jgi:hypothetical protein
MLTVLGFTIVMLSSSFVFYHYYWGPKVTYAKWTRKTNPKFPSPAKVRDEIVQTAKVRHCMVVFWDNDLTQ